MQQKYFDLNMKQDLECKLQLYMYKNVDRKYLPDADSFGSFRYIIDQQLQLVDLKLYDNTKETDGPVSKEFWNVYQIKYTEDKQKLLVINELVRGKFIGGHVQNLYLDNVIHQNMLLKEVQEKWNLFYQQCILLQNGNEILKQLIDQGIIQQQHLYIRELLKLNLQEEKIYQMTCKDAIQLILQQNDISIEDKLDLIIQQQQQIMQRLDNIEKKLSI